MTTAAQSIARQKADAVTAQIIARAKAESDDGTWNRLFAIAIAAATVAKSAPDKHASHANEARVPWALILMLRDILNSEPERFEP